MDKLKFTPKDAKTFRASATAGAVLAVATLAGCGSPSDGLSYSERIEGRIKGTVQLGDSKYLRTVTIDGATDELDLQLKNNGGANVRTTPDINGLVIGKIPAGEEFENGVTAQGMGEWVAGMCASMPFELAPDAYILDQDEYGMPILPEVCYVNGDLAQSIDK